MTRNDLITRFGLPTSVISFWMTRNLLVPVSGGGKRGGASYQFDDMEVVIAGVMATLRGMGSSIDVMMSVAQYLRPVLRFGVENSLSYFEAVAISEVKEVYRQAQTPKGFMSGFSADGFTPIYSHDINDMADVIGTGEVLDIGRLIQISGNITADFAYGLRLYADAIDEQAGPVATGFWYIAQVEPGSWEVRNGDGPPSAWTMLPGFYAVNAGEIIAAARGSL